MFILYIMSVWVSLRNITLALCVCVCMVYCNGLVSYPGGYSHFTRIKSLQEMNDCLHRQLFISSVEMEQVSNVTAIHTPLSRTSTCTSVVTGTGRISDLSSSMMYLNLRCD